MMFSTTFKRPFVTLAVVSGLLIAAAPASAGSHEAATDGTSNTLTYAAVADSDRRQTPSGFSWSETQTGLAKTADVQGGGADANGFLVDGPYSGKSPSGFSWSETQTGSAKTADANGFLVDGPFSVKSPSGFSWSETQTGSAKTADANGFVVDGPFTVKSPSGFSWSETMTGFANRAGAHGGLTATRTGTQSP